MTRLQLLIETMDHQLKANGYHLTDVELKDVAAHALMVLDDADDERRELNEPRITVDAEQMWSPASEVRQ